MPDRSNKKIYDASELLELRENSPADIPENFPKELSFILSSSPVSSSPSFCSSSSSSPYTQSAKGSPSSPPFFLPASMPPSSSKRNKQKKSKVNTKCSPSTNRAVFSAEKGTSYIDSAFKSPAKPSCSRDLFKTTPKLQNNLGHSTSTNPSAAGPTTPGDSSSGSELLRRSTNKWAPSKPFDEAQSATKQARSVLNKLTPEKFDKLIEQMAAIPLTNVKTLEAITDVIFSKAIIEPAFASIYSKFCLYLVPHFPDFDTDDTTQNFAKLLLSQCCATLAAVAEPPRDGECELEKQERDRIFRSRQKGNMVFIGELYKNGIFGGSIVHLCINMLLKEAHESLSESIIESLCTLLFTVGQSLDNNTNENDPPKLLDGEQPPMAITLDGLDDISKLLASPFSSPSSFASLDVYFDSIKQLSTDSSIPSRLRFMLKDLIELRQRDWIPRIQKTVDPKTLQEFREENCSTSSFSPPHGHSKINRINGTTTPTRPPTLRHARTTGGKVMKKMAASARVIHNDEVAPFRSKLISCTQDVRAALTAPSFIRSLSNPTLSYETTDRSRSGSSSSGRDSDADHI